MYPWKRGKFYDKRRKELGSVLAEQEPPKPVRKLLEFQSLEIKFNRIWGLGKYVCKYSYTRENLHTRFALIY